jgi:hypothetical protein
MSRMCQLEHFCMHVCSKHRLVSVNHANFTVNVTVTPNYSVTYVRSENMICNYEITQ